MCKLILCEAIVVTVVYLVFKQKSLCGKLFFAFLLFSSFKLQKSWYLQTFFEKMDSSLFWVLAQKDALGVI